MRTFCSPSENPERGIPDKSSNAKHGLGFQEFLFIDLFLIMPIATVYGYTRPRTVLSKTPPPTSAVGIAPIFSITAQILLGLLAQLASTFVLHTYAWYRPNIAGQTDENALQCQDNYAVFAVSVFQYITLAVIFSTGHPHRKPIYTNFLLTPIVGVLAAFSFYLVIHPFDWLKEFFELDINDVPISFRLICVALGLAHFFIAYTIEVS